MSEITKELSVNVEDVWAAVRISDDETIATGETIQEVLDQVTNLSEDEYILTFIPKKNTTYIL
ncbi:MAG: hypothetical protein COA58_14985 [Bacteroidetes bacterium]|nr:MAG: hypothetical protein COA58_14985 [Bacteroidota bacterium]